MTAEPAADLFAGQAKPKPRRTIDRVRHAFDHCPGLTADECALMLELAPHLVRPRISDLVDRQQLFDTGRRRPGITGTPMTVWASPEPTPKPHQQKEA